MISGCLYSNAILTKTCLEWVAAIAPLTPVQCNRLLNLRPTSACPETPSPEEYHTAGLTSRPAIHRT
jgi:hypothetical protein